MKKKILYAIAMIAISLSATSQAFDPNFGNGGKVITQLGEENWSNITDVKILTDEKILICGDKKVGPMHQLVVARYLQNGNLDSDFGTGGMTISDFGTNTGSAGEIWLLPDGKFYVAGEYREEYWASEDTNDFILVRYNANGTVDNTFGINGNGFITVDASAIEKADMGNSMFIDNAGRIIIAGEAQHDGSDGMSYWYQDFAVVRLNSDGTIDTTFATNGVFKAEIGDNTSSLLGSVDYPYEVKAQADGKIVVCGISDATSAVEKYNLAMIRLNEDGTLDQSFGAQGKVLMDLGGTETFRSFQILSDGKYLAVGNSNTGNTGSAKIVRLNADGAPDTTFGINGIAQNNFDIEGRAGLILDSFLLPDGKILACGAKVGAANLDDIVMRFNTDGTLDDSFGTNGRIVYDFMNGDDFALTLDVNASGDFIVCGGSNGNTEYNDYTLAKFLHEDLAVGNFQAAGFSVYPNPFTSILHLDFNLSYVTELNMTLLDINGRKIKTFNGLGFNSGANAIDLAMPENLAGGLYILRVFDEKNATNIKIVK